jgi:hypothetical protein
MKYGHHAYQTIGQRYKNREIEEKQWLVDFFRQSTTSRPEKMSKILLNELLGEIATDRRITLRTLPLWCMFYEIPQINVLNPHNRTYVIQRSAKSVADAAADAVDVKPEYICYDSRRRMYRVLIDESSVGSMSTRCPIDGMLQVEEYNKPFKSISNYKVSELQSMMDHIGITTTELKPKKQDLYQALYNHCAWIME